ncbi:MAG: hypothetical protein ACREUU_11945, partial [Gammaproteobacteria bacterium]
MVTQTLPSNKVVSTDYDQAGKVTAVTGYSSLMAYAPHGGLKEMRLASGLWENAWFNCRLQPSMIGLGSTQRSVPPLDSDWSSLKLEYNYRGDGGECKEKPIPINNNNGNVRFQNITVPDLFIPGLSQTYGYDALNRLQTAAETGNGDWAQTYAYDRYGNRWVSANSGLTLSAQTPIDASWYNAANNRINGYTYDDAGNQQSIVGGTTFAYDAENRLRTVTRLGADTVTYDYDGEGRRVKKVVGANTTIYVYNALGQLAAEYESPRQATNGGRRYLTADHLGSTRLITDEVGAERSRHDYLPFGEDLP